MIARTALIFGLAAAAVATLPARGQVIEIGETGARTYTGPTRFTDGAAIALMPAPAAPPHRRIGALADLAPAIAMGAAANGLDPHLVEAVAWRESRFAPDALSARGARGPMQLMPGTAHALGVDPRVPAQNIEGGARYLRMMADRFGDWRLALAAYNAGPGAVAHFGGIPPFAETRDYVRSVLGRWQGVARRPISPPANPFLIEVPAP